MDLQRRASESTNSVRINEVLAGLDVDKMRVIDLKKAGAMDKFS